MYTTKRPAKWPVLLILAAAALFISACGTAVANSNWPGMAALDNVVYLAYGQGVIALDLDEEAELWSYRPSDVSAQVQLFAQPSIDGQSVVVGDYGDSGGFLNPNITVGIYGLISSDETANVEQDWKNDSSAADRIIASPLQVGQTVYVGTADNFMLALDKESGGSLIWQFEADKPIWSRPAYQDGVLYIGSMDGTVYALDSDDGTEKWSQELGGAVSGNVVLENGLLYVNTFDQSANALDPSTGEIVWSIDTTSAIWGASAVNEDRVFLVDLSGMVIAADARTGEIIWQSEVGELVQAGPALGDGIVYIVTAGDRDLAGEERTGSIYALSAESGEEVWSEPGLEPLYTPPLVVGDSLVVAMNQGSTLMQRYDAADGSLIWTYDRPEAESEE